MAGERTLIRLYLSGDDCVESEWMLDQVTDTQTMLRILGMLEHIKIAVSGMLDNEDLGPDAMDDIRKLLDE